MIRNTVVGLLVVLALALALGDAKAAEQFPHVHEVLVGNGSYRTVIVGYVGSVSEDGLPTLALTFKLGDSGTFEIDEFLDGCEYWDTVCTSDVPAVDAAEALTLAQWAADVLNGGGYPSPYSYGQTAGLSMPMTYQFLRDAGAAIRFPGLPGRWVTVLEHGRYGISLYIEGNYPNGGLSLSFDTETKVWYAHRQPNTPEWQALLDYTLAVVNGQPADDPNHWQIDEYGDFLRDLREFQRSAVYMTFVPTVR